MTAPFSTRLISWQQQHGRHDLPWQQAEPYRVWVSEIMLQQTQVSTVVPYFQRFMARFPDLGSLAASPLDSVLAQWAGLGYYARARNLHRCAQVLVRDHHGTFPRTASELSKLPGIGRSTAAAIAAFCFGERAAILDGNVRRVLCRHAGIAGYPGEKRVQDQLWALAEARLPATTQIAAYTQGLMDLGSLVCTRSRPNCPVCPVGEDCCARRENRQQCLPEPRPRKALPRRQICFLLLHTDHDWLLQRRPLSGLWGGLLAPLALGETHLENADACLAALPEALSPCGLATTGTPVGPFVLHHTFTHFQLEIEAWRVPVSGHPLGLEKLPMGRVKAAALPTPVKKLLVG